MQTPRLAPLEAPYPQAIENILSKYPQGPEGPIRLFRTLAHSERILDKIGKAGLLDKASPISMKEREILILRTSFNRHTSYEWGIHVKAFSGHVGLTEAQVIDTCARAPDPGLWEEREGLLLVVADELSLDSGLSEETWQRLRHHYDEAQILEIIALVGFYHMIAFFNNSLAVEQEEGTPTIPGAGP